jgi:hypothetical protein
MYLKKEGIEPETGIPIMFIMSMPEILTKEYL